MSTEKKIRVTDPAEERQFLDAIDKWLAKDVKPHVASMEHDDVYPAEMVEQMKAMGLLDRKSVV